MPKLSQNKRDKVVNYQFSKEKQKTFSISLSSLKENQLNGKSRVLNREAIFQITFHYYHCVSRSSEIMSSFLSIYPCVVVNERKMYKKIEK